MQLRFLPVLCCLLALAACMRNKPQADVLGPDQGEAVAMTVKCLEPVSDGTCNKKTCAKDSDSDCNDFGVACIRSGHRYEGTRDAGTCSRVSANG